MVLSVVYKKLWRHLRWMVCQLHSIHEPPLRHIIQHLDGTSSLYKFCGPIGNIKCVFPNVGRKKMALNKNFFSIRNCYIYYLSLRLHVVRQQDSKLRRSRSLSLYLKDELKQIGDNMKRISCLRREFVSSNACRWPKTYTRIHGSAYIIIQNQESPTKMSKKISDSRNKLLCRRLHWYNHLAEI